MNNRKAMCVCVCVCVCVPASVVSCVVSPKFRTTKHAPLHLNAVFSRGCISMNLAAKRGS